MAVPAQVARWLRWYTPLLLGYFDFFTASNGAARRDAWMNALGLTKGRHWVRREGGVNLRRRTDGRRPLMTDPIVGRNDAKATSVVTQTWLIGHANSSRFIYRMTTVGAAGVEDEDSSQIIAVNTTGAGTLGAATPNPIQGLNVRPTSDGKFVVSWRYDDLGQGTAPVTFRIYSDNTTPGTVDYATPLATVTYVAGQRFYSYTTAALAASLKRMQFAVRTVGLAASSEELNAIVVPAIGTSVAPHGTITPEPEQVGLGTRLPKGA